MATEYRIALNARTISVYDALGELLIACDRQLAGQLFRALKGSADNLEDGVLLIELREINRSRPFDIQMIQCTLDQEAENCKPIIKNQFRTLNLKNS